MGETAAKLRLIFDSIKQVRGVYLFDEFDSIGSQRRLPNDVGEIRRVLNSFLQLIEQDDSDNILLAATNYPELLDYALFRRFDDVLQFDLPQPKEIIKALKSKLATIKNAHINWKEVGDVAFGLSYADIIRAAEETIKDAIINDRDDITSADLIKNLSDRKAILNK